MHWQRTRWTWTSGQCPCRGSCPIRWQVRPWTHRPCRSPTRCRARQAVAAAAAAPAASAPTPARRHHRRNRSPTARPSPLPSTPPPEACLEWACGVWWVGEGQPRWLRGPPGGEIRGTVAVKASPVAPPGLVPPCRQRTVPWGRQARWERVLRGQARVPGRSCSPHNSGWLMATPAIRCLERARLGIRQLLRNPRASQHNGPGYRLPHI
mmetsp:Transcript_27446/g.56672  ORF Transcript_27446/g.56672 Transcript_27446/m.56672 type:complete len:209 (-) Transcript_27446:573-1199(-)